jgi:pyruvate dehydrogenase E2 component (dihydrolipoamide acetyltransferase)
METPILMPFVDPAMRAGRLMRWLRREGDFVEAGEPVAEVAADRATMDVEAPHSGVLARILVEAGGLEIAVESVLGLIETGPAPHLQPRAEATPGQLEKPGRTPISPRAKRLAHEAGFDPAGLAGSGPNGRIVESDIQAALVARGPAFSAPRAEILSLRAVAQISSPNYSRPMYSRKSSNSLLAPPQVHLEADCRLDALEAMREKLNEATRAENGPRISLIDCAVKAFALGLQREPRANIAHAGEGYVQARGSNVAVALAVDGAHSAPALPMAETLSLAEIATARAEFFARRTAPSQTHEGSSLVANFGPLGVKRALPVLVAPWTSVLALGEAEERVVVVDGVPDVALVMSVTLTFDRRAIDEVAGASLLATFKALIENPYGMLI